METVSVLPNLSISISNELRKFSSCFAKKAKNHMSNLRQIVRGSLLQSESFLSSYSKSVNPESTTRTVISAMSNTLGKLDLEKFQEIHIQKEGKKLNSEKVFLFIDGGDIQKQYSPKEPHASEEVFGEPYIRKNDKDYPLEKVCGNIDGDKGHKPGRGYFLEGIVAYGENSKSISGLNLNMYSTSEDEYKSAFDEQKKGLQKIKENFVPSSFDRVVVEDRGGDDVAKFGWYLYQSDFSFLTRINTHKCSRKLINRETGELENGLEIATRAKREGRIGSEKKWKNKHSKNAEFKNKKITSKIGYKKVALKEFPEIELTLILVWSDCYNEPLLLLTDQKISTSVEAWKYFFVYRKRWEIEKMYRELKQNFGLEKTRVRSLKKQKTMAFLLMYIWNFSKNLHKKKTQILENAIGVFELFLKRNQKKDNEFSFLMFLREKIKPLSDTYSYRKSSQFFSAICLEPNRKQLRMFKNQRMS
jgi:hypothetical protein